jgi:hypothetical protein
MSSVEVRHAGTDDVDVAAAGDVHLEVPVAQLGLSTESEDPRSAAPSFIVMRTDDNANDVEVTRVTSRCEAEAVVEQYERRGHKQSYWIAEVDPAEIARSL